MEGNVENQKQGKQNSHRQGWGRLIAKDWGRPHMNGIFWKIPK